MGYQGTVFNLFQIVHVITAIVAFGPLFLYPRLQRNGETVAVARLHTRLVVPALVLLWVIGMGLAGLSDGVIKVAQLWMTLSIILWIALMAVSWFMIRPALSDTSERARSQLAAGVGISHLLLIVGLYLMVFQPGN
jgi:uncharacterized membrane protein